MRNKARDLRNNVKGYMFTHISEDGAPEDWQTAHCGVSSIVIDRVDNARMNTLSEYKELLHEKSFP